MKKWQLWPKNVITQIFQRPYIFISILVKPEPYEMPERSPLWTAVAYSAFDIALDPNSKEAKEKVVSTVCFT